MDLEPIYCAEQIVIPSDLAEVLKAYTKEVIRRQPQDIIEFSAKYFTNLANVATGIQNTPAPRREQLRQVYTRTGGNYVLSPSQVSALCNQAGIAQAVVAKVFEVIGDFNLEVIDVDKFLLLMLAMSCEDFNRLLIGLFEVFSDNGNLRTDHVHSLISYLAPDMDPDITPEFLMNFQSEMSKFSQLNYSELSNLPCIAKLLSR
uniref:RIIa domain-containing protein n=1 Tax=Polytomella parva TaxID=51329 RepID=A0A7S0YEE2_9CHLO|mmetsp:Transcript_2167/g.3264  ORF Transcript_2167/g.3264 Transcript_2167/m.3264 type:complete len:203 (+) Transcript_2167:169-777(+)|eukprot:CAMPEP_0175045358 /NCGR_PEP_ID=MMETSP0052_2-20121109/4369_1 /TAXON_ID=51329 ORGANISM="Polytomella parva, Strain SAG 63-3" /NCGR_SAMPLE_ID=MMETSP0052_2 /ASSEMBLY_ACC=CAM_ASM_000194 /LENGTH=202 /DNA_ID=CAMNT_0016308861 /DNA_START=157 /DNA_END=765 /DNA_ORIENTATION=+